MSNINKVKLLPYWQLPDSIPSVYDAQSGSFQEMVAKVYGAMRTLQTEYNSFVDEINKTITEFMKSTDKDFKCFKKEIIEICNNYIKTMDIKIDCQDRKIDDAILYMKDNIQVSVNSLLKDMQEQGELNKVVLNSFNSLDKRVTKDRIDIENLIIENSLQNNNITKLHSEIELERARINNISSLNEGSTNGDAELIDIRTGYDGKTHDTAGNSVRYQINDVIEKISNNYESEILLDTIAIIATDGTSQKYMKKIKKGDILRVSASSENGGKYTVNMWECFGSNGTHQVLIADTVKAVSNKYVIANDDYESLFVWCQTADNVTVKVERMILQTNIFSDELDTISKLITFKDIISGSTENKQSLTVEGNFKKGKKYLLNTNASGYSYAVSIMPTTQYDADNIEIIINNELNSVRNRIFEPSKNCEALFIWNSTPANNPIEFDIKEIELNINEKEESISPKFACFGDSITSEQVTGIGTVVSNNLNADLIGNFACGFAVASDWHNGDENITEITLETPQNTNSSDNVLSNQVRRMLQHTTPLGEQIKWNHAIDGEFSLEASIGLGVGNTTDIPDIIYIAIGINDGLNAQTTVVDDTETVLSQSYSDLTRNSIASALRWSIETLQSAYPNAQIFVASPLQTNSQANHMSYSNVKIKRDIIKKVSDFCSVKFIDSTFRSGFSKLIAKSHSDNVHPDNEYKYKLADFIVNEIKNNYIK